MADYNRSNRLFDELCRALTPLSEQEFREAAKPHPHIFSDGVRGLFPRGEVTVVAAPGREGKTFAVVGLVASYINGLAVAGMAPTGSGSAVIYSAEDDRRQYARKVLARVASLEEEARERVQRRVIVPDVQADGLYELQALINQVGTRPVPTPVASIIAAALVKRDVDLLVFETASTLSEADETNQAFRLLIRQLRGIARSLGCAVLLVHHTSQISAAALPELNVGTGDIRGGTALVANARQSALLVNLGSELSSFADDDARTILRRMVAPDTTDRVTAWITLDSSKAADPPPIFFRWSVGEFGPALFILPVPDQYVRHSWPRLRQAVLSRKAGRTGKEKGRAANVRAIG